MYFYEGCRDAPELLTGDCYPKRMAWLRAIERGLGPEHRGCPKVDKRKALGLSQVQLSKRIGVSVSKIQDFETGRYRGCYQNRTWERLCSVYGSSLLEGYRKPKPKRQRNIRRTDGT